MIRPTRLPRDPGPSAWNELLPPPPPPRVLSERITADWLVIGAGWAGLAAARRLTQLRGGDRIVVLDACRVAEGPAGRNSGFMVDLPHSLSGDGYGGSLAEDKAQTAMSREAIAFSAEAAEELGMSEEAFARCGKINAAASDAGQAHNETYARHLVAMDEPYEVLDEKAMQDLTGIDFYRNGVFTPGAAMVQPALFMRAMATGLSGKADLFE